MESAVKREHISFLRQVGTGQNFSEIVNTLDMLDRKGVGVMTDYQRLNSLHSILSCCPCCFLGSGNIHK